MRAGFRDDGRRGVQLALISLEPARYAPPQDAKDTP